MKTLTHKKKLLLATITTAVLTLPAMAQTSGGLDTAAATAGITDAIAKGTIIVVAGFGISVLFMVARVIKRGMSRAG